MSGITPERLRLPAIENEVLMLPASCGPMLADAVEIADSCSRSDIECHCLGVDSDDDLRWYDIRVTEACELDAIAQAVRYLTARGLIEFHPEHNEWVRFKA